MSVKNSGGSKNPPTKLSTTPYVGDPSFNSPVHPKAKGMKPSMKMPANSGVKKA